MKKILTVAVAGLITTIMSANAAPTFYVGGNIGGNYNIVGDKDVKMQGIQIAELELPEITYKYGVDAGVIFGDKADIYRFGASVFYDKTLDKNAKLTIDMSGTGLVDGVSEDDVSYEAQMYGIEFDNYIRLFEKNEKRTDLVLGLGTGYLRANLDLPVLAAASVGVNDTFKSGTLNFKLGLINNISERMAITTDLRAAYILTPDGDMFDNFSLLGLIGGMGGSNVALEKMDILRAVYTVSVGVRYTF